LCACGCHKGPKACGQCSKGMVCCEQIPSIDQSGKFGHNKMVLPFLDFVACTWCPQQSFMCILCMSFVLQKRPKSTCMKSIARRATFRLSPPAFSKCCSHITNCAQNLGLLRSNLGTHSNKTSRSHASKQSTSTLVLWNPSLLHCLYSGSK